MKQTGIILFLFLLMLGSYSCKQGHEEPPIPELKMQQVLLDMHLAETYSQGLGDSTAVRNKFDKNYDSLAVFYNSILKHHHLTFQQFNEALNWYRKRPIAIDSLYAKVLNQLNELKAREGIKDMDGEHTTPVPPSVPVSPSAIQDSLPKSRPNTAVLRVKHQKPPISKEP